MGGGQAPKSVIIFVDWQPITALEITVSVPQRSLTGLTTQRKKPKNVEPENFLKTFLNKKKSIGVPALIYLKIRKIVYI